MSIGQVLSVSQEVKCGAIFASKVPRTYSWHLHPVGFISDFRFYPSFPTVEMAEGHRHHQTLMSHQHPVALQGPGVLYVVYVVTEHQNREVPEGSFIGDLPVLRLSGGVVEYIIFGCQVELPSTTLLGPA